MWKECLIIFLALSTFILTIHTIITELSNKTSKYSIIIYKDVDINGIYENISKAYIALTTIDKKSSMLPLTHEISHWMVILETDTDKHYLISTTPQGYVEIMNANFDNKVKRRIYIYQGEPYCYVRKQGYDVKNIKMNVLEYAKKLITHYSIIGEYSLFVNNCHHMTEYGLTKILRIDEAKDYLKRSYDLYHVIADVWNNNSEFEQQ